MLKGSNAAGLALQVRWLCTVLRFGIALNHLDLAAALAHPLATAIFGHAIRAQPVTALGAKAQKVPVEIDHEGQQGDQKEKFHV